MLYYRGTRLGRFNCTREDLNACTHVDVANLLSPLSRHPHMKCYCTPYCGESQPRLSCTCGLSDEACVTGAL